MPFESWPQKRNCNEALALTKEALLHTWSVVGKVLENSLKIIDFYDKLLRTTKKVNFDRQRYQLDAQQSQGHL